MIDETAPLVSAAASEAVVLTELPELGILGFDGVDVEPFLQGQLSNDVAALRAGEVQWSSYNSPKGRMLGTLLLWRTAPESFRAVVSADLAEPLRKRLSMYVLRAKVIVADLTPSRTLFGGDAGARDIVAAVLGDLPAAGHVITADGTDVVGLPDGRLLLSVPREDAEAVRARLLQRRPLVPSARWHGLAIAAGVPMLVQATQDLFVPQSANWDLIGGISFRKGCYPGQEIVARMHYLGRLKERLFRFHVAGDPPAPATRIFNATIDEQPCGTVVNAAPAIDGGSDLLAVVQWSALAGSQLRLGASDGPLLTQRPLPYEVPAPAAPERPKL